jgi:3',5'-cyclic-AMP phosphodiesterase
MKTKFNFKTNRRLSRRDFLALGGLAGAAALAASCSKAAPSPAQVSWGSISPSGREVVLRIAHITDMHINSHYAATGGFSRALAHVQKLNPAVDVIFNTGDCVMDSLKTGKEEAMEQWDQFNSILKAGVSVPVFHAIGNHDVWGWGLPESALQDAKSDPLFGKAMALQQLGLSSRYYSFDKAGWHFIVLDSTHLPVIVSDYPYTGKLDDEQFGWLEDELKKTPATTPVCVLSHIPIFCACEFFDGNNEATGNWVVPGAWMHIDARRMRQLFLGYPNVRLCLSGHAHQQEVLEYLGVKYLNDGAICGNWWQGSYLDFPPGYVAIQLYADGSSDSRFITYNT